MDNRLVVRPRDMLVFELEFVNLVPATGGTLGLQPVTGTDAFVVVHFPFQHLLEASATDEPRITIAAIGEGADPGLFTSLSGKSFEEIQSVERFPLYASGPTRVAFRVPAGTMVPLQLDQMLERIADWSLSVTPVAQTDAYWTGLGPTEPNFSETAIELPTRLILSPTEQAGFSHATTPVEAAQRSELWHSRLGLSPGTEGTPADAASRTVRAVWLRVGQGNPDWDPANDATVPPPRDGEPFQTAIYQHDRVNIIHLTSNFRQLQPEPVRVSRLALSALGAWLDSRGDWEPPDSIPALDLLQWRHIAAMGRDHYVRIVTEGFLLPFGHRAARVSITERRFADGVPGTPAVQFERDFIIVRELVKFYDPASAPTPTLGRTMPLRRVTVKTLVTPNIELPPLPQPGQPGLVSFWVDVDGQHFPFHFEGEDVNGEIVAFASPIYFVAKTDASDQGKIQQYSGEYVNAPDSQIVLAGSPVAFCDPRTRGDTTYQVSTIQFGATYVAGRVPAFYPEMEAAQVALPNLQLLNSVGGLHEIKYAQPYRDNGLGGANQGEVFAQLTTAIPLDFSGNGARSGGFVQPNLSVAGLSRGLGPVGGTLAGANPLSSVANGVFNPSAYFAGMASAAKLFGTFTLDQVLQTVTGALADNGVAPQMTTQRQGDALTATITWTPPLQNYPSDDPLFVTGNGAALTLQVTVQSKGASTQTSVDCTLANIALALVSKLHFMEVDIKTLEFKTGSGKKTDINVDLGEIKFVGVLSFVETLKQIIPLNGFSDPPALEVTPDGIESSYSLSLPSLAVGMFSLQNISLGAGFRVPFVGSSPVSVRFNFCEREQPFLLTVTLFGGGGFFAVAVDAGGLQRLEAAFEFGASVSMNFGVASGGVHVMGGVYFSYDSEKGATLTGYFRVGGNVSVLGILSVSIELNLSLSYEFSSGKAVGRATLTVEIDIFMFSVSVDISCERKFAGSAGDPSFAELMATYPDPDHPATIVDPWRDYCKAYA
jgi:hypothetical protein